jgi:hypothetical protein
LVCQKIDVVDVKPLLIEALLWHPAFERKSRKTITEKQFNQSTLQQNT